MTETATARRCRLRREHQAEHALQGPSCLLPSAGGRKLDVCCSRCGLPVGHDPIAPSVPVEVWSRWAHYPECPKDPK